MDNVPDIEFCYQIIRQPKKQSQNVFECAASLSIMQKKELFLEVEDICIADFIYQLSLYRPDMDVFIFVPIDSVDKVLIIHSIDSMYVKITSDWSNKTMFIKKEILIDAIELLKASFENQTKVKVEKYF